MWPLGCNFPQGFSVTFRKGQAFAEIHTPLSPNILPTQQGVRLSHSAASVGFVPWKAPPSKLLQARFQGHRWWAPPDQSKADGVKEGSRSSMNVSSGA